jgi:peptidyl-prolyl cis-trans isomerase A (cyclophilin A)
MKKKSILFLGSLASAFFLALFCAGAFAQQTQETTTSSVRPNLPDTAAIVRVRFRTTVGVFDAELYRRAAPTTVENFLRYIYGGYYVGGLIYRTVKTTNQEDKPDSLKIEVIQATVGSDYSQYAFPPIFLETTQETGVRHLDGTLSMARDEPNTAQYEFFICIGDQPQLDFGGARNPDRQGFAAFGRVTRGMDVVRKIHQSRSIGQTLAPPILIISITRI